LATTSLTDSARSLVHATAAMALQRIARHASRAARSARAMAQAQSGGRGFHASAARADDLIECFVNGEPVQVAKGSNVMAACSAAGVDVRPPTHATSLLASISRMRRMQG